MKKRLLFGLIGIVAIAAAVTATVSSINENTPKLSNLLIENLEILTRDEVSYDGYTETGAVCSKCGAEIRACLFCVEYNNNCKCVVEIHSC